jgi:undecaprenyl-diphosphatase
MAVYGFLAYVLVRMSTHVRRRFEVAYWAGVLIALVGFSRVYLRVHYATDVVGGFLVGAFWLLAGIVVARWVDCGERAENEGPV